MESYQFTTLKGDAQAKELKRVEQQSQIFWTKEAALLAYLNLINARSAIDIGCGPGFVTALIAKTYPNIEFKGLDVCTELLEVARSYHADLVNLQFYEASAYDTNLADCSQDFIYSRLVYQHLYEPTKAASEAFRICKNGGQIAIFDIDASMLRFSADMPATTKLLNQITAKQKKLGGDREIGRKLPAILQSVGFSSVKIKFETISTLDMSCEEFYNITLGYAEWFLDDDEGQQIYQASKNELSSVKKSLFGVLPLIYVYGNKPSTRE